MICSIILSNKRISAYLFKEDKKDFMLEKTIAVDEDISGEELVADQENLKNFIYKYFHGYKDYRFYVLVDGMDIQYKTVPYSGVDVTEDMDDKRIEDIILTTAKMNLPKEATQLHANYTTCIMAADQNDLGYLFSLAFIPSDYLFNIKFAFNECGFNLMNVSPLPFGIFNAVNRGNKMFIANSEKSISTFNSNGIYVWPKPDGCQFYEDELINTVVSDGRKALNADDESEIEELEPDNIMDYVRTGFNCTDHDFGIDALYAYGQLLPVDDIRTTPANEGSGDVFGQDEEIEYDEDGNVVSQRKGVIANVADKLRKLLHFGGKADGEV